MHVCTTAHAYTHIRSTTHISVWFVLILWVRWVALNLLTETHTHANFTALRQLPVLPQNKQRWSGQQRRKRLIDRNCRKNWKWKMWDVKTTGRMWLMSQNSVTTGQEARWSIRLLKSSSANLRRTHLKRNFGGCTFKTHTNHPRSCLSGRKKNCSASTSCALILFSFSWPPFAI